MQLKNVNTPNGILFGDDATNLCYFLMTNNPEIRSLDLSASEKMGQRGCITESTGALISWLHIECCPLLENLDLLPEKATIIYQIDLYDLPKLEKIDLSQLTAISRISLGELDVCDINYVSPTKWFVNDGGGNELGDDDNDYSFMRFGITEDVYNKTETQNFLSTYHSHLRKSSVSSMNGSVANFNWKQYYDPWTSPSD